jgi:hypothetical protein
MDHPSTGGSSLIRLKARATEPSSSQFPLRMPSYLNTWMFPPYFFSSLKKAVLVVTSRSRLARWGPLSPWAGSPRVDPILFSELRISRGDPP